MKREKALTVKKYLFELINSAGKKNAGEIRELLEILSGCRKILTDAEMASVAWKCRLAKIDLGEFSEAAYVSLRDTINLPHNPHKEKAMVLKGYLALNKCREDTALRFIGANHQELKRLLKFKDVVRIARLLKYHNVREIPVQLLKITPFSQPAIMKNIIDLFPDKAAGEEAVFYFKNNIKWPQNGAVALLTSMARCQLGRGAIPESLVRHISTGREAAQCATSFAKISHSQGLLDLLPLLTSTLSVAPSLYSIPDLADITSSYAATSEATKSLFDLVASVLWVERGTPPDPADLCTILLGFAEAMVTDARESVFKKALRHLPVEAKGEHKMVKAFKTAQVALV
eukprot:TRINITY_DN14563_c4_g1_i1.p1 TRINITY_DN14563_c4_g1~~TRINITY_DN14563_c4_g1_i1.p1  ORF type:complete len:344 (+),score=42.87 TRINITY_DN14563_c4_g1_i1:46-1077(+)